MHEMKLREVYFNLIKSGEKIYEIRLNDEKRKIIDVGDTIIFKKQENQNETLSTIVKDLIYFDSFADMINTLPLEKIGFKNSNKESVEAVYHSFYSVNEEQKYGIVAIKVEIL